MQLSASTVKALSTHLNTQQSFFSPASTVYHENFTEEKFRADSVSRKVTRKKFHGASKFIGMLYINVPRCGYVTQ